MAALTLLMLGFLGCRPRWSQDGKRLVFTGLEAGREVFAVHDLETGKSRKLAAIEPNDGAADIVWDPDGEFPSQCNMGTFDLEKVSTAADITELKQLIENHRDYTGSPVAEKILASWEDSLARFVKVMPTDYKRVLAERAAAASAA